MIRHLKTFIFVMAVFFVPTFCLASVDVGTVNSTNKYAWGENMGWINFAPTDNSGYAGITITKTAITGYAWSPQYGWINFNPTNSGQGVLNNCSGELSGYAWVSELGWLNMSGVVINSAGKFTGAAGATSTTVGRVNFDCDNCNVITDWRPICSTIQQSSNGAVIIIYPTSSSTPQAQDQFPIIATTTTSATTTNIISATTTIISPITIIASATTVVAPQQQQPNQPAVVVVNKEKPTYDNNTKDSSATKEKQSFFSMIQEVAQNNFIKIISLFGLMLGIASLILSFLISPIYFEDLRLLASKAWDFFPVILGLKKKPKNPWGTVYDSVTKQPLDPAYVLLQDVNGQELKDAITDLDGRYGFLAEPGNYKLTVNKSNYIFPSQKLNGQVNDEIYDNLYFGGSIALGLEQGVIANNIPMDSIGFDWNEFAKRDKKLMKFYSNTDRIFNSTISIAIFALGFIFSLIVVLLSHHTYNIIIFSLYIIISIANIIGMKPKFTGRITDAETNEPFSFAILKIFSASSGKELFKKVCDKVGRYYCLVSPGKYIIKIDKKNIDGTYSFVYASSEINAKKGIVRKHFKI
ncbi:MAG: carboxypeptidase-like regulatory domain-containing protein [Candidatus Gribaldobacteria bacterium]|nr:carboxypeptidase-like regulatory domain-containing protein [Candidatus Gribaldobacteria bacterium]